MPDESFRIAIDRIEGDTAVVTIGERVVEVPTRLLPEGACEGSLLQLSLAPAAQAASAHDAAEARLERLRRASPPPSGPIDL